MLLCHPLVSYIYISDMPTFAVAKEGDLIRLVSCEGPPWLALRGRNFLKITVCEWLENASKLHKTFDMDDILCICKT